MAGRLRGRLQNTNAALTDRPDFALVGVLRIPEFESSPWRAIYRRIVIALIVLFAEGPKGRAAKLLEKEKKKVSRVAPGVPVHTFIVGTGEGELPPRKIRMTLTKLRPALSKEEMSVVNKRLKSLPGIRQGVPAGVDPSRARMNRSALRGR